MTKLIVELDDFAEAARAMRHEVAENVELCLTAVAGRLQPDLVGVDPAGVAWAADYDPAVRSVLAASAVLADGAFTTSQLFAASGRNYALAEDASTTGGGGVAGSEWTVMLADHPTVRAPHVPSAGGAGHDTPADWWLVEHTIGVLWPGGHQDRLRATADAWRTAARGLDAALGVPLSITARFVLDTLPEADNIRATCQDHYDRLTTLTGGYRSLADSCEEYATHLDTCHQAVEAELTTLARDSVITQGVGAALSFVSFGLAEIPTQAAQAARIATAANRIRHLIDTLTAAAKLVGAAVARIRHVADDIHNAMQGLTTTRIAYAGITNVPRMRRIERTAMTAKDGKTAARAAGAPGAGGLAATGDKLMWTTWRNYPKVERDGQTYARIGDRLYSRHAVDRIQPRGLGAPAGAVGAGRSISPTFIEDVLRQGKGLPTTGPHGEARLLHQAGDVRVITEQDVVVTVMRVR